MRLPAPLLPGTLVRRYKRFFADVRLADGTVVTAHCPNPGSMLSVNAPGSDVWLSRSDSPTRKLAYTWELVRIDGALVGINTHRPNAIVAEAIAEGRIAELEGYAGVRREVRYGRSSRIDLLLEAPGRPPCWVEVKNVTMKRETGADGPLEFPDAVTARGAKHLDELAERAAAGDRAVMLFLAQRGDGSRLAVADDIDPAYARALARAIEAGVEALCYACAVDREAIAVDRRLPIVPPALGAVEHGAGEMA